MAALAGASPALAGARITAAGLSSAPRASFLVLPPLPRRSFSTSSSSKFSDACRFTSVRVRASSSSEEASSSTDELLSDLKEKWDAIDNKSAVFLYGGGAIVAVWLSSILVGAINSVPLLPKIMELVGLGYSGWFVYRYLLFKSSRKELADDIEELKQKIAGTGSPEEEAIAAAEAVLDSSVGLDTPSTDEQSPEVELVNSSASTIDGNSPEAELASSEASTIDEKSPEVDLVSSETEPVVELVSAETSETEPVVELVSAETSTIGGQGGST